MNNRIIVVDDEQDFLESVKRGLITSGFKNVRTETDPLKAAADFENEEEYDIGLIDITMPGMDGIELLEIIKSHSPKTECIMITAVDEARMAYELGDLSLHAPIKLRVGELAGDEDLSRYIL